MRVAFLGPAGTFTEEALRASAGAVLGGAELEAVARPTVYETVMAVHDGAVERAVVPIENSLEGGVAATLDALATEAADVRIAAELVRPIRHCLIARDDLPLEEVRRVISHPQALAQCARFLRERLPRAERVTAASTAEAAAPAVGRPSKTSLVFWGFNDESPGALVGVLRELSERGINLTRIESRPRRLRLGHYMFFADIEGSEEESRVAEALSALRSRVQTMRALGSYPTLET